MSKNNNMNMPTTSGVIKEDSASKHLKKIKNENTELKRQIEELKKALANYSVVKNLTSNNESKNNNNNINNDNNNHNKSQPLMETDTNLNNDDSDLSIHETGAGCLLSQLTQKNKEKQLGRSISINVPISTNTTNHNTVVNLKRKKMPPINVYNTDVSLLKKTIKEHLKIDDYLIKRFNENLI